MKKHNFKIGDRVKLKGSYCGVSGNDIGEVIDVSTYIKVLWSGYLGRCLGGTSKIYPHRAREIEHTAAVGEQLLFDFMEEN